jgi:tape measure domain-containing protein
MAGDLKLTLRINADGSAAVIGLRNLENAENKVGAAGKKAGADMESGFSRGRASVQSISKQLSDTRTQLLELAGLHFGRQLIADLVDANTKLQSWRYGLEAATGSQGAAAEALAFVRAESQRLGLSLSDSATAFTRLSAATKGTALEGVGAQKVFTGIAEAARTLHLSGTETNAMLTALDQMMSKGTVQAQDLKLQLGNTLPGAMHIAADAIGVTTQQFDKMMDRGQIVSEEFLPKFAARLHELYGATAAESANSPAAQLERLKNSVFELKAAIGDAGFMSMLAAGATTLAGALTSLVQSGALDVIVRGLIAIAGGMAAAWALGALRSWITSMLLARVAIEGAAAAQTGLNLAMRANPIGIVVTALFALYEAYEYVSNAEKKRAEEMASLQREVELATRTTQDMVETLRAADGSGFGKLSVAARTYGADLKTLDEVNAQIAAKQKEFAEASTIYLERGIKSYDTTTPKARALAAEIESLRARANALTTDLDPLKAELIAAGLAAGQSAEFVDKMRAALAAVQASASGGGILDTLKKIGGVFSTFADSQGAFAADKKAGDAITQLITLQGEYAKKLETAGKTEAQIAQMRGDAALKAAEATGRASDEQIQHIKDVTKGTVEQGAALDALKEKTKDAGAELVKKLQEEAATFGIAKDAMDFYTIATTKMTDAQREAAIAAANSKIVQGDIAAEATKQAAAVKAGEDALRNMNASGAEKLADLKAELGGASAAQIAFNKTVRDADKDLAAAGGTANTAAKKIHDAILAEADATRELAEAKAAIDAADNVAKQVNEAEDPFAKQNEQLKILEAGLKAVSDANSEAFNPAKAEEYKKAIAGVNKQTESLRYSIQSQMVGAASDMLKSIQSTTREGSKEYAALELATDSLAIAQGVLAVLAAGNLPPPASFVSMAAMAATVASVLGNIGKSITVLSGGGGPSAQSAQVRQENQGTGTVLGDAKAQSDSIAKAMDITASATSKLVGINTGMLRALTSLQQALGAAGTQLAQGAGNVNFPALPGGNALNGLIGSLDPLGGDPITKALNNALFGGSKKVIDQGIVIAGGALQDMLNGIVVGAYQTIHKSGGLFSSGKNYDQTQAVSDEFTKQFQLVIGSIVDTVRQGALALGLLPADIEAAIAKFQVAETHISLQGLSAEDQQKALEAVFSQIFDGLAGSIVPFIGKFQKVGEGLGETLVRVATEVQITQEAFKQLGFAINTTDPEKFAQIADGLVTAAGGIDNLITGINNFTSKFASGDDKFKYEQDSLNSAFSQMGLTLPTTREGMYDLMKSLDATTAAGQNQIATLLKLTDIADQYYTDLDKQQQDALTKAKTQSDAKAQYDAQVRGLDLSLGNVSPLIDQLQKIRQWGADAAIQLNALAKTAGNAGASESDLAKVQLEVARQAAAAIATLKNSSRDLAANLGYVDTLDSLNAKIAALQSGASTAASSIGNAAGAIQSAGDALNLEIGDLSPYSDQKKLDLALQGLRAGSVSADQVLQIGRRLYSSGDDYNKLFEQVLDISKTVSSGGGGGGSSSGSSPINSKELAELIAQRDEMQAQQRKDQAHQLAQNIADLAQAQHESVQDVAKDLGINLADIGKDLGISQDKVADFIASLEKQDLAGTFIDQTGNIVDAVGASSDAIVAAIYDAIGKPTPASATLPDTGTAVPVAPSTPPPTGSAGGGSGKPPVNPTVPGNGNGVSPQERAVVDLLTGILNAVGMSADTAQQTARLLADSARRQEAFLTNRGLPA